MTQLRRNLTLSVTQRLEKMVATYEAVVPLRGLALPPEIRAKVIARMDSRAAEEP